MSTKNDFMPTRRAAQEFSERSIAHSREFMSHPEAVRALGELAPRLITVLDSMYAPTTYADAKTGIVTIELPDIASPRNIPVVSVEPDTTLRIINHLKFAPDEEQRAAIEREGMKLFGTLGEHFVDRVVDMANRDSDEEREEEIEFTNFSGLTPYTVARSKSFIVRRSPLIALNMHDLSRTQSNPYVLLHEAIHSDDILESPLVDIRRQGFYKEVLRQELRGHYVSATVLRLQDEYVDIFRQYNTSYQTMKRIQDIEDARSRHNDFLGIDRFEPNPRIDEDLRQRGIFIIGKQSILDTKFRD